jgi:hypothetical protein
MGFFLLYITQNSCFYSYLCSEKTFLEWVLNNYFEILQMKKSFFNFREEISVSQLGLG